MNYYAGMAVMAVALFATVAFTKWSEDDAKKECYKAAQVNTNIKCDKDKPK